MRMKYILKLILVFLAVTLSGWMGSPAPVYADECGGDCSVVLCDPAYTTICPAPDDCYDQPNYCSACGGNGCQNVGCPPGQFMANDGCRDIGDGDGDTCFPAGTDITMADGSRKNIEEVEVGERVMSQSEGGVRGSSRVERLIRPVSDNMCRIEFEDGEDLEVTKSHPFLTEGGWKAIDEVAARREQADLQIQKLEKGDALYREDGGRAEVAEITCWDERVQVYNFTVDNDHTYFAGGYLAHNKGAVATDCRAPKDCPANNSCVPTTTNNCAYDWCTPPGSYACYPFNIDTNHYVDHYVVSKAQYPCLFTWEKPSV